MINQHQKLSRKPAIDSPNDKLANVSPAQNLKKLTKSSSFKNIGGSSPFSFLRNKSSHNLTVLNENHLQKPQNDHHQPLSVSSSNDSSNHEPTSIKNSIQNYVKRKISARSSSFRLIGQNIKKIRDELRDQNPVSTRLNDRNDVNLISEIDNSEQIQENSAESDFENKNETEKCENCKKYKNTDNDINYNFSEHLNKNDSKLTIMMNNPFRTKKIFKKDHQSSIKKIIDGDNHLFSVTPLKSSVNHGPSVSLSVAVIEDERRNSVITSDSGNDSNFELSEHSWSQNSIRGIKNTTTTTTTTSTSTQKIRITNIKSSSETLRRKKYNYTNSIKNNFFSSRPTAKNILKSKSLAIEFNKIYENSAVSNNFVSDSSETKTNLVNSLIPENTEESELKIAEKAKVQSRPVSLKRNRPLVDMESLKTWRNHFHSSVDDKKEHHKEKKKHKIELPIFSKRYRKFKRNLNSIEDGGDNNNHTCQPNVSLYIEIRKKKKII